MTTHVSTWCYPKSVALAHDEVHVWRAELDRTAAETECFWQMLTSDERARARRFHFERDQSHFIAARGMCRTILAGYTELPPNQLRFCYSQYGKPMLADECGGDIYRFNLSHSGGLALYAVTRGREVGIDLERIRLDMAALEIAAQFFSAREIAALYALPTAMQHKAFYNCWTRKEAYIKARGEGLTLPLDQFDVSLVPGEPALLLSTAGDQHEASRWSLHDLNAGAGYVAAVAVQAVQAVHEQQERDWQLRCYDFNHQLDFNHYGFRAASAPLDAEATAKLAVKPAVVPLT